MRANDAPVRVANQHEVVVAVRSDDLVELGVHVVLAERGVCDAERDGHELNC